MSSCAAVMALSLGLLISPLVIASVLRRGPRGLLPPHRREAVAPGRMETISQTGRVRHWSYAARKEGDPHRGVATPRRTAGAPWAGIRPQRGARGRTVRAVPP